MFYTNEHISDHYDTIYFDFTSATFQREILIFLPYTVYLLDIIMYITYCRAIRDMFFCILWFDISYKRIVFTVYKMWYETWCENMI